MGETYYHGTPVADEIFRSGFDVEARKRSDPGDFGWGLYFTQSISRAKCYGQVLRVEIDTSTFAHIPNPYFLKGLDQLQPETELEQIFYGLVFDGPAMKTVIGRREDRILAARLVKDAFLSRGHRGISTNLNDREVVIFDAAVIHDVKRWR